MAWFTMYPPQNNGPHTTITSNINSAVTDIAVSDASVLPAPPNVLTIGLGEDAELVRLIAKTGNVLTVERGYNGTTSKAWNSGEWMYRAITAQDIAALQANTETIRGQADAALPKAGGTMTGELTLKNGVWPQLTLLPNKVGCTKLGIVRSSDTGVISVQSWEDDSGADRRALEIADATVMSLDNVVRIRDVIGGVQSAYRVYHDGMATAIPISKLAVKSGANTKIASGRVQCSTPQNTTQTFEIVFPEAFATTADLAVHVTIETSVANAARYASPSVVTKDGFNLIYRNDAAQATQFVRWSAVGS